MVLESSVKNVGVKYKMTCMCETPIKEYSKTTCTCCWWCKRCGKYGGCDNMYWMSEEQIKEKLKLEKQIKERLRNERHKGTV